MCKKLYTICNHNTDPYYNLALEEYLLSRVESDCVILYLWQNDHTVVIGRNQNPWVECRTELLQSEGGKLARRLSGGGAVYHDLGNLNFTFLCSEKNYNLQKQLSVIQAACQYAGISPSFSGRNDLLVDGKKFSGNAFYHAKGMAYHHGTLLIHSDLERLQRYLSPPKAKLESKGISSVRSRVTNLSQLSPTLTCSTMTANMLCAFSDVYAGTPTELVLKGEDTAAINLLAEKYRSEDWLFGKPFPFTCTMENHFSFGNLQLQFSVKANIIEDLQVYTDAMDAGLPSRLRKALQGCPFLPDAMCIACAGLDTPDEFCRFFHQQFL